MALNLIKLCVGIESPEQLARVQEAQLARAQAELGRRVAWHVTRQTPRRRAELLDGGALYWVIQGRVQARQRLLDVRPIRDSSGRPHCVLELDPALVRTRALAHRPFQGWRYLPAERAPADVAGARDDTADMPDWMVRELSDLGLL